MTRGAFDVFTQNTHPIYPYQHFLLTFCVHLIPTTRILTAPPRSPLHSTRRMLDNSSHIIPTPEHFEQQFGANGTNSSCQPFTATALLPSILVVIQCALLHPAFAHSQLLRLVRKSLTPINFYWSIRLPFQYCIRPLETSAQFNMIVACMCIYVATKSLEWGFATSSYYKRPLITVNGVSRLEKVKDTDQSYKKLQEDEPCNVFRLMTWTLLQFTSSVDSLPFFF